MGGKLDGRRVLCSVFATSGRGVDGGWNWKWDGVDYVEFVRVVISISLPTSLVSIKRILLYEILIFIYEVCRLPMESTKSQLLNMIFRFEKNYIERNKGRYTKTIPKHVNSMLQLKNETFLCDLVI